jgi:hypothetical protein
MRLYKLPIKEEQICRLFIDNKNKLQARKFASVPFSERIVFAPHCLRNISICTAIEKDSYYSCAECDGCKISKISKFIKKLNYKALYVVKGGRAIEKIIKENDSKAVVGIACFLEGSQAFKMLKDKDIAIQFIPLTKDGCSSTDTNLKEVEKVLKRRIEITQ